MEKNTTKVTLMKVRLATEPDGPYAQHSGDIATPVVDVNGNQWVIMAVDNGSGSGTSTQLEAGFDQADHRPDFSQGGVDANGLAVVNHLFLFNGDPTGDLSWDRARDASAVNVGTQSGTGAVIVEGAGEWSLPSTPAAAAQATVSKAAVAGVRHVCKSISFSLNGTAAQPAVIIALRDGATGVGTIIWSLRVGPIPAGDSQTETLGDLNIVGTAGNAMTLEFTTAPAATNFESVSLTGYDAS